MTKMPKITSAAQFDRLFSASWKTSNEEKWNRGELLNSYGGLNIDPDEFVRISKKFGIMLSSLKSYILVARAFPDDTEREQAPYAVFKTLLDMPTKELRDRILKEVLARTSAGDNPTAAVVSQAIREYKKYNIIEVAKAEREGKDTPLTSAEILKLEERQARILKGERGNLDTSSRSGGFWLQGIKVKGTYDEDEDQIVLDIGSAEFVIEHTNTEKGRTKIVLTRR